MTTGTMPYFTCAYVNLRVLRETLKCTLPIEVGACWLAFPSRTQLFYASQDELPPAAIDYIHQHFADVTLTDISKVAGAPSMKYGGL